MLLSSSEEPYEVAVLQYLETYLTSELGGYSLYHRGCAYSSQQPLALLLA